MKTYCVDYIEYPSKAFKFVRVNANNREDAMRKVRWILGKDGGKVIGAQKRG